MKKEENTRLKEIRSHGTKTFPCAVYRTSSAGQGMMVKHHWHDEVEMLYFNKGGFLMEINMEVYPVESECICFVNPGELHSIEKTCSEEAGEDAIVFHPVVLSFESYDAAQMELLQPIQNGRLLFPRQIIPGDAAFDEIRQYFREILEIFHRGGSGERMPVRSGVTDDIVSQMYIKSSLLRILAVLWKYQLFTATVENGNKRVEEIKKVLSYIKSHYDEKIYIRDLAGLINMNEQYFCRFFKRSIGRSPMVYINEFRIRQAMHYLEETDDSVTEVAMECGYNNLGNFLREFHRQTGTTPLKYRKNSQNTKKSLTNI